MEKNQKDTNFEHIIIDGKSTDRTVEIIKKHKDKINVAKLVAGAPMIKKTGKNSIIKSVIMNKIF